MKQPSLLSRITRRVFGGEITRRALARLPIAALRSELSTRQRLAVRALDDVHDRAVGRGDGSDRDRRAASREEIIEQALTAWRENPLARRIVDLTSDYVVGGGINAESVHAATNEFLREFWNDRLNRMPVRCFEWCDELTRSGELFVIVSTDAAGMSYVRAMPAADIAEIETAPNDIEQETRYLQSALLLGGDPIPWQNYNAASDTRKDDGSFAPVMLHYCINRPVGALRGESDLAPLLRWLTRYSAWLEDRVRLNRFRQTFLFWVKRAFANEAERLARQNELNANPPNPGSILVTDDSETWEVIHPKLDSYEASQDGLAVKKMLSAGAGIPMHFLAEPEGATRTTAEQAGGPTFRHFDRRQHFFTWMICDIVQIAVRRRAMVDSRIDATAFIKVDGEDISVRDNSMLAQAATSIVGSFIQLRDRNLIDDSELIRMVYKFAGEVIDVSALLKKAGGVPVEKPTTKQGAK